MEMTLVEKNKQEVETLLDGLIKRMGSARKALDVIGEIVTESIQRNFEEGGRPNKWEPLAESTIKQRKKAGKWPGKVLVRSGVSGGLMGAISYKAANRNVVWSANKVYAAAHHFGRGVTSSRSGGTYYDLPPRPFMLIQDDDWPEINETMQDFIIRGKA